MRINRSQAPVSNPAERKPPPKPPPKGKKTKKPLVLQSLNGAAVPPAPDWGPLPGIGGSTFSHPTLDEDNDPFFFTHVDPSMNTGHYDNNTVPSPFVLPCIDVPLPPAPLPLRINATVLPPSRLVLPHIDLQKPPAKWKLSTPVDSTSSGSALAGSTSNLHATTITLKRVKVPHTASALQSHLYRHDLTVSNAFFPSAVPSIAPSIAPSVAPSVAPSIASSVSPSVAPSVAPSHDPFDLEPDHKEGSITRSACSSSMPSPNSQAWETTHDEYGPNDGTGIASEDIEHIVHALAVTMRGSQGTNLIKLVPISYHFDDADPRIQPLIARNLLDDGNLIYSKVYFDEHGTVQRSQWNREIILRSSANCVGGAGFFQPNPSPINCPCVYIGSFCSCSLCSWGQQNQTHEVFSGRLSPRIQEALARFKQYHPELCAAAQHRFWDEGRITTKIPDEESSDAITFSRGLSEATIEAELAQLQQPPLQLQPEPPLAPPQPPPLFS
ncbi:hypothetical protein K439DRAFT_1620310 [Ramaria rubella]|nr:hypothetical protein K439DRAFT_1620310 [Ramaria rubella]